VIGIAEIVDGVIVHAQRLLDDGAYDWPASRAALQKSWSTETRSVDDPNVERLRRFIALTDDAWNARSHLHLLLEPARRHVVGPMGRMILTVLGMVADMELGFIRERQRTGIEIARAVGCKRGNVYKALKAAGVA